MPNNTDYALAISHQLINARLDEVVEHLKALELGVRREQKWMTLDVLKDVAWKVDPFTGEPVAKHVATCECQACSDKQRFRLTA